MGFSFWVEDRLCKGFFVAVCFPVFGVDVGENYFAILGSVEWGFFGEFLEKDGVGDELAFGVFVPWVCYLNTFRKCFEYFWACSVKSAVPEGSFLANFIFAKISGFFNKRYFMV